MAWTIEGQISALQPSHKTPGIPEEERTALDIKVSGLQGIRANFTLQFGTTTSANISAISIHLSPPQKLTTSPQRNTIRNLQYLILINDGFV